MSIIPSSSLKLYDAYVGMYLDLAAIMYLHYYIPLPAPLSLI